MPLQYENGDGADALLYNQIQAAMDGSYWSGGVDASPGTNAMEVDLTSGSVVVNGATVSVSAQTVTLTAADADPRKDIIYVDSNGSATVVTGVAASPQPAGEVRADTYVPAPPDRASITGVVVAEVWVPGGAADIQSGDIRDRRLPFGAVANAGAWSDSDGDGVYQLPNSGDGIAVGSADVGGEAVAVQSDLHSRYTDSEAVAAAAPEEVYDSGWQSEGSLDIFNGLSASYDQYNSQIVVGDGSGSTETLGVSNVQVGDAVTVSMDQADKTFRVIAWRM